jgi:hypothetical protein
VAALDGELAALDIPWDEWEVLYRLRLQVDRDLRAARGLLLDRSDGDGRALVGASASGYGRADGRAETGKGPLTRLVDAFRSRLPGR